MPLEEFVQRIKNARSDQNKIFDEFIQKLKYTRLDREKENAFFYPTDEEFQEIISILKSMYHDDKNFREYIISNDIKGLIAYLRDKSKSVEDKYGYLLHTGYLGLLISIPDFNLIFRLFKDKHEYHEKVSLESHLKLKSARNNEAKQYITEYTTWDNVLKEYYDDVIDGDFSRLLEMNKRLTTEHKILYSLQLYVQENTKKRKI